MLIEIPEPDVILSVILAFIIGLGGLYLYYKVRPFIKTSHNIDSSQAELLEYYERQLIDMKIRLDALDIVDLGTKTNDLPDEVKQMEHKVMSVSREPPIVRKDRIVEGITEERMPNSGYGDVTNHVLQLITDKSMTSRDIQITIGRSREHTSRLMKKLFEDGFVERNTKSKPYTYSITEKGREKLRFLGTAPTTV